MCFLATTISDSELGTSEWAAQQPEYLHMLYDEFHSIGTNLKSGEVITFSFKGAPSEVF